MHTATPTARTQSRPHPSRRWRRWLALPATVIVFVSGVWVAGGVITESFQSSMALVAAWYAVAGAGAAVLVRRRSRLALPVAAGYVLSAGAIGILLAASTLRDRVVDEPVVVGTPASRVDDAPERPAAVTELRGDFVAGEHATRGAAAVVRTPRGDRVLTLTGFATSPGPDLRVRLVPGRTSDGAASGAVDLGALKGNQGNQQYDLPRDLDGRDSTVVIWCRAFSASFGSAALRSA